MDLEHYRKDAKRLARSFRAGEGDAVGRAKRVFGERAHKRFQLSDAQHIVAVADDDGVRTALRPALVASFAARHA